MLAGGYANSARPAAAGRPSPSRQPWEPSSTVTRAWLQTTRNHMAVVGRRLRAAPVASWYGSAPDNLAWDAGALLLRIQNDVAVTGGLRTIDVAPVCALPRLSSVKHEATINSQSHQFGHHAGHETPLPSPHLRTWPAVGRIGAPFWPCGPASELFLPHEGWLFDVGTSAADPGRWRERGRRCRCFAAAPAPWG